ncbi:hypothetical protein CL622_01640, partial [archaeon]|nr:hypothetical protein [archaeon]
MSEYLKAMKSKNYLVIGIIVIWGLFVLSGCVNENEILIQSYSYSYKKDISSHQIRGIWETLSFKYENTEFT